ncbi:probable beta-1,3-galactosyltransferase 12 [Cryptomeria japonica]|uniref:probable beta-1,3-galactosyltransferase 12 n=1 Tax=Cryptomeria japonica TaxID=3369 RepID=UPI0027DA8E7E|nr:probable beta-1,3-galactosyltransferase 12 [Cryptomeria japonica]
MLLIEIAKSFLMQIKMLSSPSLSRKLLISRHSWSTYSWRYLFAFCCICCGMLGIILSIYITWGPVLAYQCEKGRDTTNASANGKSDVQNRQKVLGFVGIQTGFDSVDRRRALRKTWLPSDQDGLLRLEEMTGLAFRFVIGQKNDATKMRELESEIKKYNDFLRVDTEEDYHKLQYKTLAFFKAAFRLFDADYYVKADDDIYLRPDRLSTLLAKKRFSPRTYLGCMKKGPVFKDPNLKWYEPLGDMLGNEYFIHAYGPIYVLSAEIVAGLAVLNNDRHQMEVSSRKIKPDPGRSWDLRLDERLRVSSLKFNNPISVDFSWIDTSSA